MDRRPKKSRPSDIFRNNVNFDKCITKLDNSPAEYTIISENGMRLCLFAFKLHFKLSILLPPDPHLVNPMDFWTNGDPEEEWLDITDEDRVLGLTSNIEPLSKEAIRKKPPLVRSGTW